METYNPLGNIALSAIVAFLPIALFFVCLVFFKTKGYVAAALTAILAAVIAVGIYDMPVAKMIWSFIHGAMFGVWPIAWIIIAAIFLYKLCVKSGYFDILRESIIAITPDQRIQVILIGFCFGAFLEGAIGFGGPVAITAALLVGLGLNPLYAAGLCMIANTAPVAFGAVGIPIIAMAGAVDNGGDATQYAADISYVAGHMLPPLSLFVPFFLIFLMNGLKGVKETWPVALVAGGAFALTQYFTATHLGPELPDIASAVVSIACVTIFLRFWQPKNIFKFDGEQKATEAKKYPASKIALAWSPFVILIFMIIIWTLPDFKALFGKDGALNALVFSIPLPEISVNKSFSLPLINSVGTAIFITALITMAILKVDVKGGVSTFVETLNEMKFAILTIMLVVGFAYISNHSQISTTLAMALTNTGDAFAFFSPVIGWLGVFITGSDTSSNVLFGGLQQITARELGLPELLFLAANSVGGVVGKMISPQSIAIACAAVGLVGRESELFRFTVKYSVILVIGIGVFTYALSFFIPHALFLPASY